jgi:hypothetical protein
VLRAAYGGSQGRWGEEFFGDPKAIDRAQIAVYNPSIASYEGGQKWVYVFDAFRDAYLKEIGQHAIATIGYRLGMLQRGAQKAEAAGNYVLAAQLLKQAAEDAGGSYTNEKRVTGSVSVDHRLPDTATEARQLLQHKLDSLRQIGSSATPAAKDQVIEG